MVYLGANPFDNILSGYDNYDFNLIQRLLSEMRVVIYYFSLIVFPHPLRLNLIYNYPLSTNIFEPLSTFMCILAIFCLTGLAVFKTKKNHAEAQ